MAERTHEFLALYRRYSTPDYNRCAGSVPGGPWGFRQCSRKKGHGLHGAWCKQHDPATRNAKDDTRLAAWRAENDAHRAAQIAAERKAEFLNACAKVVRGIADGSVSDPLADASKVMADYEGFTE